MFNRFRFIGLLILFSMVSIDVGNAASLHDSVAKIFVTTNRNDYYRPWQSKGISQSSGSGAIIKGDRILTNAHVVADHTFIQVKKNGDPKKYIAKVEAIGHDCDLALLSVEDSKFFEGVTPIPFGDLPRLQDTVTVVGFPKGGDKISITEGVVSRLEVTNYSLSSRQLLAVQIDAAINSGNSGGPVLLDGKLVGIAMQVLNSGQNIGYIIPRPIIDHFFKDLEDGQYNGFPMIGIEYNTTENKTLREYYGIDVMEGGIVVVSIAPYSPSDGVLQKGDVILQVADIDIGEDGSFQFRGDERLTMTHLITKNQVDDGVKLTIIRDKKKINVNLNLTEHVSLVPHPYHFEKPTYYIYGGLVFTVLSTDLLMSWGKRWWEKAPLSFNHFLFGGGRLNLEKRKEVVVLLNVLSDDINVGYHTYRNELVDKVNGKRFDSFKDFVILLNSGKKSEKYTVIETEDRSRVILDNSLIDERNDEILKRNNIPKQYSDDVAEWLN